MAGLRMAGPNRSIATTQGRRIRPRAPARQPGPRRRSAPRRAILVRAVTVNLRTAAIIGTAGTGDTVVPTIGARARERTGGADRPRDRSTRTSARGSPATLTDTGGPTPGTAGRRPPPPPRR